MGWRAYGRYYQIITSILPLTLKIIFYNHCILPVLTYEAEEVNNEVWEEVEDRGPRDVPTNVSRNVKRQEDNGVNQWGTGGSWYVMRIVMRNQFM